VKHPLTGAVEEKAFQIRISRDPLHVYLVGNRAAPGKDGSLYASCYRPDGVPEVCDLTARFERSELTAVTRARTNRFGVARLPVPAELAVADGRLEVELRAAGPAGEVGRRTAEVWPPEGAVLVVPERTLYHPGETAVVHIQPLRRGLRVLVEARTGSDTLFFTRTLDDLRETTRLELELPAEHRGRVDVIAVPLGAAREESYGTGSQRTLWVPDDRSLELDIEPSAATLRPGETARLTLQASTSGSEVEPTVVAVAIVDAAVEARAESTGELRPSGGSGLLAMLDSGDRDHLPAAVRDRLTRSRPDLETSAELDLLAEVELFSYELGWREERSDPIADQRHDYRTALEPDTRTIAILLRQGRRSHALYDVTTGPRLLELLAARVVSSDRLEDPWGTPYWAEVTVDGSNRRAELWSAGLDRDRGTVDDFKVETFTWPVFGWPGGELDAALALAFDTSERLLHHEEQVAAALAEHDWLSWRDPWGGRLRVAAWPERGHWIVGVFGVGPDGVPAPLKVTNHRVSAASDDVRLWRSSVAWGLTVRGRVEAAIEPGILTGSVGQYESETRAAIDAALTEHPPGVDPWDRPLFWELSSDARYIDAHGYIVRGGTRREAPVAATVVSFSLNVMSMGRDGIAATEDDFVVTTLRLPTKIERAVSDEWEVRHPAAGHGTIVGSVVDDAGETLPGVTVEVHGPEASHVQVTNAQGLFTFSLPAASYSMVATLFGFSTVEYPNIVVRPGRFTTLDLQLTAAVEELLMVTSEGPAITTRPRTERPARASARPIATPRLRHEFPETVLWLPHVELDVHGRAELDVPLADNVTTWNVSALASTRTARLAPARVEIRAELPFSIDPDLPTTVTTGDRIAVPILLENRTHGPLDLALEIAVEGGRIVASTPSTIRLQPTSARRLDVPIAVETAGEFSVRVEAAGPSLGDAARRSIESRPDGEAVSVLANALVGHSRSIEIVVPEDAIGGLADLEVTVHQDLLGHLEAATSALQRRPRGCSEQIMSAAWPSLLVLEGGDRVPERDRQRAREFLEAARDGLMSRQVRGGFSYWDGGRTDVALTAMAIQFLQRSRLFVGVDPGDLEAALRWIELRQGSDGAWLRKLGLRHEASPEVTALVTLALAPLADDRPEARRAVERGLDWLHDWTAERDDPYVLALTALAADEGADKGLADILRGRLSTLARRADDGTAHWTLRTNTPFHGWGRAGRIETTAVAVRALAQGTEEQRAVAVRGQTFLLLEKDAAGAWISSQATTQALMALRALDARSTDTRGQPSSELAVEADGRRLETAEASGLSGLQRFTLPSGLPPGRHRIRVYGADSGALVLAVARFHRPWEATASGAESSDELRFEVDCAADRAVGIDQTITCRVTAERIGYRGSGMLVAEVGLPPGVVVDRQALAAERRSVGPSRFEVRPDRVIAYLWPRAGGTTFDLSFRARTAMCAKATPSVLYDYYNAEARLVLAPPRFEVFSAAWPAPCDDPSKGLF